MKIIANFLFDYWNHIKNILKDDIFSLMTGMLTNVQYNRYHVTHFSKSSTIAFFEHHIFSNYLVPVSFFDPIICSNWHFDCSNLLDL